MFDRFGIVDYLERVFGKLWPRPTFILSGALTCYACDTDASPNCITDPGDYSSVLCKSTDTHCYTYRIETGTGASISERDQSVVLHP